eukprot:2182895-Rhodomonas_salina.1
MPKARVWHETLRGETRAILAFSRPNFRPVSRQNFRPALSPAHQTEIKLSPGTSGESVISMALVSSDDGWCDSKSCTPPSVTVMPPSVTYQRLSYG